MNPDLIPLPQSYQSTGKTRAFSTIHLTTKEKDFQSTVTTCQSMCPKKAKNESPNLEVLLLKSTTIKNPEGYQLIIPEKGQATINASTSAGAFYGVQSLLQLAQNGKIPVCTITDAPRFAWRGLMLDEARHFMGKKYVMHLLRTMAAHKMNRFHWHLTDDQGWRIEIKQYPYLTKIGAWRGPGTQAPVPKWDEKSPFAKIKYGGFYTQKDIKEIVAYASSLHIEILPEIDVPGHAMAIALSYPQVLPKTDKETGKGVHGLKGNVLSVVNNDNYRMLDDIFGEIASLFPFPYIHVGGDEVNVNAWKASPKHREFMKQHNMKNLHQLQNMFMLRLEKILQSHGKTLMGWNEIMHGGHLSKNTGIMAWISIKAGINAAKAGYPTVMAVGPHNYFDMKYPGHGETGHWWAGAIDTKKAYSWNPLFENQLSVKQQQNILGVHCALWTEFVPDPTNADYKLWPRACATSEVGWTKQDKRQWNDFSRRLEHHLGFLDSLDVGYRVKPPQAVIQQGEIIIRTPYNAPATILYTIDGSIPSPKNSPNTKTYHGEKLPLSVAKKLKYLTLRPNGRTSKIVKGAIREPIMTWNKKSFDKNGKLTQKIDVSHIIHQKGNWILEVQFQGGKSATRIIQTSILSKDGTPIIQPKLPENGLLIDSKNRVARLKLPITSFKKDSTYILLLTLQSEGKKDSRGRVLLDASPWMEPAVTLQTKVPHYSDNTAEKAVNWVRSDWFWSSRNGKKGDQWNYTFQKPTTVSSIEIPTGKPNTNDDIIVDATIEISQDGKTFRKVGSFAYGTGKIKFDQSTPVKMLRITLNSDHQSWIIIRDLEIK